jgi:hypothetical protein
MSYGTNNNNADRFRQIGVYVGKILNGTKPANLPVLRLDLRWYGDDSDINRIRVFAQELVGLQPEAILAAGGGMRPLSSRGDADDPDHLFGPVRPRCQRHRHAARPPE